jgi:peptidoglycan/LPS O-acetylase OafA/YrhL
MNIADQRSQTPGSRGAIAGHRRPDLQGMRAIAVLTVFANHLFDWPAGGFVGVDVFFVLSGFFITGILIRERATTGKLSFQGFYVRRVKRILPSAVLVLIATVIGSYVLFPAIRAKETLVDALYAAVFAANFHFEAVGADYFQQTQPPSPLQHYWSLSIEEQFYFVWPALLVLIFALTRGLRRGGKTWARQQGLFGAMAIVVTASFGWAMFLSATDPNSAYFSTFTRVWELGVGALVAIAGPWLANIPSAVRPGLAYLGVAGVMGSLFLIDSTVQFPAPWAALPVLSTALVVASFHGAEVRGMFLLTNPVARYFGDTSYTLYLWHWPVIILLFSVIPKGPLFYALALALALGLTAVTYHFYENPIRKSEWLLDKPAPRARRVPALSRSRWALIGALMVAVIVQSILGIQYADRNSAAQELFEAQELLGAQDDQWQATNLITPAEKVDPCFGAPAMLTPGCVLRDPEAFLRPSIDEFSQDTQGVFNCYREKGAEQRKLPSCNYGYMGGDATRIALVGDSHAASLLPALWPILNANKWRLTTYLGQSCGLTTALSLECKESMAEVQAELLAHPYALVLTTNLNGLQRPDSYQSAWAPIAVAGSRIAVVPDNPLSSEEALACLTRVGRRGDRNGECGTSRAEALPRPDPLIAAAQLVPGTTLIDLTPYYCTADRCPSVICDVIVYRDYGDGNSHITATFATTLAGALEDGLRRALGV